MSAWSFVHRVNSRGRLVDFVRTGADVAEGDVRLGSVGGGPSTAIMAHPPDVTSDLDFATWVDAAVEHGHAIKVDLKERGVIPQVIAILRARRFDAGRIIINADCLRGPGGGPPALSRGDLLECRRALGPVTVSVGATTAPGGGGYTAAQIEAFRSERRALGEPTTLALRAELVLADATVLCAFEGAHLSIWNAAASFPADDACFDWFRSRLPTAWIDLVDGNGAPVFGTRGL